MGTNGYVAIQNLYSTELIASFNVRIYYIKTQW